MSAPNQEARELALAVARQAFKDTPLYPDGDGRFKKAMRQVRTRLRAAGYRNVVLSASVYALRILRHEEREP